MLNDFFQWLSDFFISLVAYVFIKIAELFGFLIGLLPPLPANVHPLSFYLSGVSADIISFIAYMQIPAMLAFVVVGYSVRLILMIFGR